MALHHHDPQRPDEHANAHHERRNRIKPIREHWAIRHHVSMSFASTKKHSMAFSVRNELGLRPGDSATHCVTFATSHVDNSERIDPSHAIGVSGISTGSAGGAFFN